MSLIINISLTNLTNHSPLNNCQLVYDTSGSSSDNLFLLIFQTVIAEYILSIGGEAEVPCLGHAAPAVTGGGERHSACRKQVGKNFLENIEIFQPL